MLAMRMPGLGSPDFPALEVLADVLDSQRFDLYGLVPQGKATSAEFTLDPLPQSGIAYAVLSFTSGEDPKALDEVETRLLQEIPYRGSLPTVVPTDPLIYRFYELVQVYGTTWKELIQEEFGDGIMSAIDFDMAIERQRDPKGDRIKLTLSGKFLPYKEY